MKFNDAIFGLVVIVISLAVMIISQTFPQVHGLVYGPDLFPTIIGGSLFICGVSLFIRGLRQMKSTQLIALDDWTRSRRHVISICLIPASLVFYIAVVDFFGFALTAGVLLIVLMVWLRRKVWSSIIISVLVAVVTYQFFSKILLVPLPIGTLQQILGLQP